MLHNALQGPFGREYAASDVSCGGGLQHELSQCLSSTGKSRTQQLQNHVGGCVVALPSPLPPSLDLLLLYHSEVRNGLTNVAVLVQELSTLLSAKVLYLHPKEAIEEQTRYSLGRCWHNVQIPVNVT